MKLEEVYKKASTIWWFFHKEYDSKLKESPPNSFDLVAIRLDIKDLSNKIDDGTYKKITKENIDYVLNILNIFSELSKIKFKQDFNDSNKI